MIQLPSIRFPLAGIGIDASLLAGITFTNTISTGVIVLAAIASVATVIGVIYGVRYKSAYLAEKAVREAFEDRNALLMTERDDYKVKLDEATATIIEAQRTIAQLEPLKSIGVVLEMITDTFDRLVTRQEAMHVEQKLRLDQQTLILLDEVRGKERTYEPGKD